MKKLRLILAIIIFLISLKNLTFAQDEILYESIDDNNSEKFYEYLAAHFDKEEGFIALQRITEPMIRDKDWQAAIDMYTEYKKDFPSMKDRFDKIIKILKAPMENLEEQNLGTGVNGDNSEYSPLVTADDQTIYFTGKDKEPTNESEDIYSSKKFNDVWLPAQKVPGPINSDEGDSPQSISTDENTMILFGAYKEHLGKGDLYYSEKNTSGWSEVKHYDAPLNSAYFDCDAKLTNDGKAIIFVSDRPGGIGEFHEFGTQFHGSANGNTDIYVVEKTENGWGPAINLGKTINTPYSERKPFLHYDGKSLYFSSDGHAGLGKLDIFKSTKLKEDSWTEWSTPVNLGKEVNSAGDDRGAVITTFGDLAYFASSDRNINYGKSDIYQLTVPENMRPERVVKFSGTVKDNQGNFLEANIIWEDLVTGKKLGQMKSNPKNGNFFIVLPVGKNYGIYSQKEGFFPISKNLDLRKERTLKEKHEDIVMLVLSDLIGDELELTGEGDVNYDSFELKNKKKLAMNNLFFEYNKWTLLSSSFPELDRIVYMFKNYPLAQVEVSGHTDSLGNSEYNMELSEKRANAVMDYLIKKGVEKEKLVAKGYGMVQPLASNETEEGRQQNRRVELQILRVFKKK